MFGLLSHVKVMTAKNIKGLAKNSMLHIHLLCLKQERKLIQNIWAKLKTCLEIFGHGARRNNVCVRVEYEG